MLRNSLAPFALLVGLLTILSTAGCGPKPSSHQTKLVVWGMELGAESAGLEARIKAFERMHPDIRVSVLSMGAGTMDPQKLMTSIVGNVPPDVIHQDRFTIGDWASRGTFVPLNSFIDADKDGQFAVHESDYYPACWKEATYTNPTTHQAGVYAIPDTTDDRALFYNKEMFRKAGIVDSHGNPLPPKTWSELLADAKKLTTYNADGTIKRIGFIPNYGNSWLYLYSWQNGGSFMSPDGRTCTLNAKPNVEALEYMVKTIDSLGGISKVDAFQSGFQPDALDPFLTNMVAMKIDGSWVPANIARYKPDLDFGLAPAPVPSARYYRQGRFAHVKHRFITWAGGFSYAIPKGAKHKKAAWEFIKWMMSPQAALIDAAATKAYDATKQRPFVPGLSANRAVNAAVFAKFGPKNPRYRDCMALFIKMMDQAKFRPVTFVGQRLWDEQVRAMDSADHHDTTHETPQQALNIGTSVVQHEINKFFDQTKYPVVPPWIYDGITTLCTLLLLGFLTWRVMIILRLRRMARQEAVAGVVFVSPWIIGFLIFTAGPMLASLLFSFCDYDVLHPARWVGLHNYVELLGQDGYYLHLSLYNAFYIAVIGIPLGIVTGLSIAMLLNAKVSGMSIYRTAFYLPSIVPVVASAVLWIWILNADPHRGLINALWTVTLDRWFKIAPPGWLSSATWSKPALLLQGLWGAGSGMILWLAGLQGIPGHLYEAAELDGAGVIAKFRNVTIPMLSPYIFFNLIMGTIGALQQFDNVYVLSGGDLSQPAGPVDSLLMPVQYLFKNAFQYFKMGYASALAWVLFVMILALTATQLKLAPRWVYYEGEQK